MARTAKETKIIQTLMQESRMKAQNGFIGKKIEINIFEVVIELEKLSGKELIKVVDLPAEQKQDWDTEERRVQQERMSEENQIRNKIRMIENTIEYLNTQASLETDSKIQNELLLHKANEEKHKINLEKKTVTPYNPQPKPQWLIDLE